jgi:heat shock protein HslJ
MSLTFVKSKILLAFAAATALAQSSRQASFQFPGGETIRATIYATRAVIGVSGKGVVSLKNEVSASGAKYSDGYTVFWEKGGVAMLEAGTGKWQDCKLTGTQSVASPLQGRWTLAKLAGAPPKSPKPAFVDFAPDGKKVSGSLGCNRFTGAFTHDSQNLSFGPLASMRMACIGDAGATERALSKTLGETKRLQIFECQLTLTGERGTTLAVLKKN